MIALLTKLNAVLSDLPLSRKILAITTLSSLVTLTAISSISFYREWTTFSRQKTDEIATLASMLGDNAVAPLRFQDPYRAKGYVDALDRLPNILSASIYDKTGNLFAQHSNLERPPFHPSPDFTGERWSDERLYFARDIVLDGALLGKILIEMDTTSYKSAIKKSLLTAIFFFLGGLAITIILASRLQSLITQPVKELAEVAHNIAERKDYTHRATKRHNDEIGSFVDSFNAMLEVISKHDETLLKINSSLEKTVEERTKDLQKRNESLKEAMEAANAASIAKSEFLAATSHELRTPLNPIIGYIEMLLREEPDRKSAEELGLIQQSAKQLLSLIEEILDFSKIERGTIELDYKAVDVQGICQEVVKIMTTESSKKGLSITYRHIEEDNGDNTLIECDESKLKQVLFNLIGNAIKFTNEGSIEVISNLPQTPSDQTQFIRIEVKDTGIGIEGKDMAKLFKPFSQVDSSLTREYGGIGLGLAISQRIVQAMGGHIVCHSEKGNGSCFKFELPFFLKERMHEIVSIPSISIEHTSSENTILLVEDEAVNRELMDAILSSLGYKVTCAKNGLEALELAKENTFSLILMDISMPRMDGYDAAIGIRKLENNTTSTPIIAMTAHATRQSKQRCMEAGMNDYLSKPISFTTLKKMLAKWTNKETNVRDSC